MRKRAKTFTCSSSFALRSFFLFVYFWKVNVIYLLLRQVETDICPILRYLFAIFAKQSGTCPCCEVLTLTRNTLLLLINATFNNSDFVFHISRCIRESSAEEISYSPAIREIVTRIISQLRYDYSSFNQWYSLFIELTRFSGTYILSANDSWKSRRLYRQIIYRPSFRLHWFNRTDRRARSLINFEGCCTPTRARPTHWSLHKSLHY